MKAQIVRIGNSRGLRIPKPLLDQTGLTGEVHIIARNDTLVIRRVTKPRANWEHAFEQMAQLGDDALLDDVSPSLSRWDEDHWQW